MSDTHPYWSYGPDHGVQPVDALAEGRRTFALELAAFTMPNDKGGEVLVRRARAFEAYLAGAPDDEITVPREVYEDLAADRLKLVRLEAAGVDNWEGYDEALADPDDED